MDGGFSYGYSDQIAEPIGSYAYHGNVVPVATSTNLSPITTLRFDPYQELLWSGNEFGRVASSFGPTLADYTAFVVGQMPVREIEVTEDLVLTVGGSAFSGFKREGLLQFVHCSPHFENLTCAHRLPIAPNSILLGGLQNKIVQMDLSTLQEQRIVPLKQADCLMIRSNENALFTTDSKGNITMRSMNTVEAVNSAPAHTGGVTDFEVMGNQLVTCGYSGTTRYGTPFSDPFLKVYDVRNFGSFVPLSVSFPPFLCRFLGFDGDNRMVVLSKYGHLTIVDIQTMQVEPLYQFFEACVPTTLTISSSAQAIALGDPAGCVHFLADRDDPLINLNSYMTTFPVMEECLAPIPFCDVLTPLASVPVLLPQSSMSYSSDLFPNEFLQRRYLEPIPVPSDLMLNAKKAQNVLYAPAPYAQTELRGLNVCPYAHLQDGKSRSGALSQETSSYPQGENAEVDVVAMPSFYRRRKGRVRSGANAEAEVAATKEPFLSLNELVPFQFINPLLLITFYILPLRKLFLEHFCDAEHCVSCQLSFLYRMMMKVPPSHTLSAANLVRTLRTYGEVGSILRLAETALAERNRRFINFIFSTAEKELPKSYDGELGPQHSLDHITLKYVEVQRCTSCGTQWMNEHDNSVLRLCYTNQTASNTVRFSKLLEDSLNNEGARFDSCSSCMRRSRIPSWREVKRLPSVLCLDTDITSASAKEFWKTQFRAFEKRPSAFGDLTSTKICRYGRNCRGIGGSCRFRHPDQESPDEVVRQSAENWSHYLPLKFGAKFDGNSCVIQEGFDSDTTNYILRAIVALIKEPNESCHYVTLLRLENEAGPRNWALFNGHYVTTVTENEALYTSPAWKEPLFLVYANVDSEFVCSPGEIQLAKIPAKVFANCSNQSNIADAEGPSIRLSPEELPVAGDEVGIDAEFVTISECGSVRSVGRVSCVKENGDLIIDDYIKTPLCDTVHDYLTQYSGIQETDLNPLTSTKHLATFKSTYTKILYMIENGVIFVGHALSNDFNMLNIYVPEEQIRDTVRIYSLPNQRMMSLQFLAKQILDETIQEGVHDSVEDAKAALRLYKKYSDLDSDSFLDLVKQLYVTWERTRARSSS